MKFRIIVSTLSVFLIAFVIQLIVKKASEKKMSTGETIFERKEKEEKNGAYQYLRWKYEADMIKDPVSGEIPFGMREQEIEFAKTIPARGSSSALSRVSAQNTYLPAGPNNIGGRTRALAYDIRYNGTTNRVILAGSVSGGIFRTADGGANWTRVSPNNEIHNVTCVVQDPRNGNQNIWYAGGGEYVGSSTDASGAGYYGYGLFKSIDNGVTWTRLPLNNITDINGTLLPSGLAERFDHPFDYVHKIAINPNNGDVYVAGHRRIMRSTNGGTTFQTVFGSTVASFGANGQCDVIVSPTGKVYIAMTGSTADLSLRGIWKSTTGNQNSFTRLAGGNILGTDSVANWRGNAYDFFVSGGSNFYDGRRTLMALAPSNENILYVLYENGLSNASPNFDKEADLFKLDMSTGNVWTNLSANLPDFDGNSNQEATDPFAIQDGYDLFITVKPNDPNFVILGGTSLYRSTNGFSSTVGTSWIGGYGNTLPSVSLYGQTSSPGDPSRWSHPDIHNLVFNPTNVNEAICANDGGLQITSNIAGTSSGNEPVAWTIIKNYQTLQYFKITIDPEIGAYNFVGGSQDNGTQFRDKTGILGVAIADSNNHRRLITADGGSVGISKRVNSRQILYGSFQLGNIRRGVLQPGFSTTDIEPNGLTPVSGSTSEFGEFVTNFKLDPDNTEDLYYVNFNRLFRTTSASIVTSSSWTELTGVSNAVNSNNGTNISIRALGLSRGDYTSSHALYIGTTDGRVFRLDGPRNAAAISVPVNISPPGITGLNIQDISVNPNNDNEILVAITNYGITSGTNFDNVVNIWWTDNAKSASPTWRQAEGNLAGTTSSGYISARSCMIVVKKDAANNPVTEYYVGTSAGLFSVENLGATLLANGTPNWQREAPSLINFSVINSIAYRPGDNVMAIGTHGNGLYYTFLGTPNLVTAVTDPVLNDKTFIAMVYPTISNNVVQYKVGNKFDVKKINIHLINMQGQLLYKKQENYSDGSLNLERFAKGAYILSIYSDNQKYKHVQKLIHN